MLRTELVELVNNGRAWAFVGAGVSADAGLPGWDGLVQHVLANTPSPEAEDIRNDREFVRGIGEERFDRCFSLCQRTIGRPRLEELVRDAVDCSSRDLGLASLLADWPFAGFITTNYDLCIETALRRAGLATWLTVGNTAAELPKTTGDVEGIVWHVHGCVELPSSRSKLVLTEEDYDDLYLADSAVVTQLRALLANRRVVMLGVGFKDMEIERLLKSVRIISSPSRPAFAFVGIKGGYRDSGTRSSYLAKYNIDVVPYSTADGSHAELKPTLQMYQAFILKRSQRYGGNQTAVPSYDPETTGLLIYNKMSLQGQADLSDSVVDCLARSRTMALLMNGTALTDRDISLDLAERIRIVSGRNAQLDQCAHRVSAALLALQLDGIVSMREREDGLRMVELTEDGRKRVAEHAAVSEVMREQFLASILERATALTTDYNSAERVSNAACSFLFECVQRKALGVAQELVLQQRADFAGYHGLGLLQGLPEHMSGLAGPEEARALVQLVAAFFASRNELEDRYLGLILQASFGVHLLGLDPDALRARTSDLANTVFVIDSTTMIPLLAQGSIGHEGACYLVDSIVGLGATPISTSRLVDEVLEHAKWPIEAGVVDEQGHATTLTLAAVEGRDGYRSNVFLSGFVRGLATGSSASTYSDYLDAACQCPFTSMRRPAQLRVFVRRLEEKGLDIRDLESWQGFDASMWAEIDAAQAKITELRKAAGTYKHPRQTKAEAEACAIVQLIRSKRLRADGPLVAAYFVSPTRVVDLQAPGQKITVRPEVLIQWFSTVKQCGVDELRCLVDELLWELSGNGLEVVDKKHLSVAFSPLISASKEHYGQELDTHRLLTTEMYGADQEQAFRETDDLYMPIAVYSLQYQVNERLAEQVVREREQREKAEKTAKQTERERKEIAEYKAKKAEKAAKNKRKARATKSKSHKGSRKH